MEPLRLAVMAARVMERDGWFQIPCRGFVLTVDSFGPPTQVTIDSLPEGSYEPKWMV